jgi:hypothetical protein
MTTERQKFPKGTKHKSHDIIYADETIKLSLVYREIKDLNSWPTCISGSIPVLNAKTRLAVAPIVVKILVVVVPGML